MPLPDTITPEWLREQLFEFDKYHGIYREHPFEGWAIWQWLNGERGDTNNPPDEWATAARE